VATKRLQTWQTPQTRVQSKAVIYCVVPPELEDELFVTLCEHFKDNPNVRVILDRRKGRDRRTPGSGGGGQRATRDRRRSRLPGTFPSTDPPTAA
jgi:hypothetical protein